LPELSQLTQTTAKKDRELTDIDAKLAELAPSISSLAGTARNAHSEVELRDAARSVVAKAKTVIIDIDEVECPHCGGRGQTGLVGDLCIYCGGSCFVSTEEAENYDKNDIDEVPCPRCGGRGQTGLVGDLCAYCGGSCFVSREEAEEYNEKEIDQVECPRCGGRGQAGLVGDLCKLCRGSTVVTQAVREAYIEKYH